MDMINLSVVRQSFAQAVFTHQVQEIAARNKRRQVTYIKWVNILLVATTLIMLLLQVGNPDSHIFAYLGSGTAVAEILFLIIQLTFSYEQEGLLHKDSALKYMALRDRYRMLIADIMSEGISRAEIQSRRDALQSEYQSISDLSPNTGPAEYSEAQKSLNKAGEVKGEQFTWSDAEIDRFLPQELRLGK